MSRSLPEWRGKTHDSKVPPRVKQRIYDAADGICHICELPIKPAETWHADHVIALIEGGENREGNLAPAHAHCNLEKANQEKTRKAKVASARQKHIGIRQPSKMQGRGFPQSPQAADKHQRAKDKITLPPRRSIYRSE